MNKLKIGETVKKKDKMKTAKFKFIADKLSLSLWHPLGYKQINMQTEKKQLIIDFPKDVFYMSYMIPDRVRSGMKNKV